MWLRLLRGDLARNRVTAVALLALITTATLLVAAGAGTVATVSGALDRLFDRAKVPHAMQMHAGDIDADAIDAWGAEHPGITATQVLPTYPLPVGDLVIGGHTQSDSNIQPSATAQSPEFDVLLGMDNAELSPDPGTVHLPLVYRNQVDEGGEVTLGIDGEERSFHVAGFLRDAQMNPSMVTSKRILFHPSDIDWIARTLPPEYLVEFRVAEGVSPQVVLSEYEEAGFPTTGPAIDGGSIKLLAGLSSTLIVGVLGAIALVVALLGMLTVRLTVKAAVAGDLPTIGVLKAIGLPERRIRWTFLVKYVAIAVIGALLGTAIAPLLHGPLTDTAILEMGAPDSHLPVVLAWILSGLLVAVGASLYCWWLLRPIRRVPALTALRASTSSKRPMLWRWKLSASRLPAWLWWGLRGASARGQLGLLALAALITLATMLPAQVTATFRSPGLSTFLGVGATELLVEARDDAVAAVIADNLPDDPAVEQLALMRQSRGAIKSAEGWERLPIDVGDHTTFPVNYSDGAPPATTDQIALSFKVADGQGLAVGDVAVVRDSLGERELTVCGIYQDISNGGATAKGTWDVADDKVERWAWLVELGEGQDVQATSDRWQTEYPGAAVIDIPTFGARMMGGVVDSLQTITLITLAVAGLAIWGLTALFLRMVLAHEATEFAALRGIGLTDGLLRRSLTVRYLALIGVGSLIGLGLALLAGRFLVGPLAGAILGAPRLQLMGVPWLTAVGLPIVFAVAVILAVRSAAGNLTPLTVQRVTEE